MTYALGPKSRERLQGVHPKLVDVVAKAMFAAADTLGVEIRWGADWDRDGKPREKGESDSPHFELVL